MHLWHETETRLVARGVVGGGGACFICKMVRSIALCAHETLSTRGNYLDVCVYSVNKKAEGRTSPSESAPVLPFWNLRPLNATFFCCCGHF